MNLAAEAYTWPWAEHYLPGPLIGRFYVELSGQGEEQAPAERIARWRKAREEGGSRKWM